MPDSGTVTYDYPAIQQCVDKMRSFVQQVEAHGEELTGRTKALMAGHWVGVSAEDYDQRSTNMRTQLDGIQQALTGLHGKVSDGAQEMQDADRRGASH
ncbi:WXG100 family type VII secretion target [Pseudonocardia sp. ICBG1122]|nr:WXG100 family type VII secretion target [Pseudonocardia pini]